MNKLNKNTAHVFGKDSFALRLLLILVGVLLLSLAAGGEAAESPAKLVDLCKEFNVLNSSIRDSKIKKTEAKVQFKRLVEAIRKEYYLSGAEDYTVSDWVFPLKGYGHKAIGGVEGNGYQPGGYDYFDGNRHTGHPAQDIFSNDKKHVSLDNETNEPVSVLSLTGGVIVAVENSWEPSSSLRGGKYIWIYDPTANALIYYAHNSKLYVAVGETVKPGSIISEVGRTGFNAYKNRSPTHLHLTCLSIDNGLPKPRNIYKELLNSNFK